MAKNAKEYLEELISRYVSLQCEKEHILDAYHILEHAYDQDKKLLVAGNGGSASDAEHIVGELMKGFVKPRHLEEDMLQALECIDTEHGREIGMKLQRALPAITVVDHVALSTAYLNDVDPLLSFAQQVYGYGRCGDVFLGISTSGNSQNIINACIVAKAKGMKVIGLTGGTGGRLKELADAAIVVPESETYKVQELHLPVYHALCLMLEERFFG